MKYFILIFSLFYSFNSYAKYEKINNNTYLIDYGFYQLRYNCDMKSFDMFTYETVKDSGNLERYKPFHQDLNIPKECRQKSTKTYKRPKGETQYDRGHGTHSNIWDHSKKYMKATNMMTNIVPHERTLNRHGLWRYLEMVTECYRDENTLTVFGGNIWGNDSSNDHFINSHGVTTPDHLYKIIIFNKEDAFAWIMPNTSKPHKYHGDQYLTTINDIEEKVGYTFSVDDSLKNITKENTPRLPKGCDIR